MKIVEKLYENIKIINYCEEKVANENTFQKKIVL